MHVLIYSYFPPLADHLLGGAQAIIDSLVRELAMQGLRITFVCPPAGGRPLIPTTPRVAVVDALVAVDNQDATPAQTHHDLWLLHTLEQDVDVILSIDQHYPLHTKKPVILSLNNFSYGPETRSAFGFGWDAMVVPSDYCARCVAWYFSRENWLGDDSRPVHVVPPAVTQRAMDAEAVSTLRRELGLRDGERYLTFPHRPDPDKGFDTALLAVVELRRRGAPYTLLVPAPPEGDIWPHQRVYMAERRRNVESLDAASMVLFHRWIGHSEMSAYLQLAEWVLCPSRLPETFGLSVVEAIAASRPVVATRSGAVKEVIPPGHGVEFIEFHDFREIVEVVVSGVDRAGLERGRSYVEEQYNLRRFTATWLRILSSTRKNQARYIPTAHRAGESAPWVQVLPSGRVWDDYRKGYVEPCGARPCEAAGSRS